MAAVAEIVLQMDDSGVVTALQRTQGGLTRLGSQGNVILTGLGSRGTRTTAVFQRMAGAVGMVDARFLALARLGPAGIIGAIGAAVVVASQRFRSFEGAIDSIHFKLSLFQDRFKRFLGFGTSDLLAGADAIEEQKLLIPLIEKEAELRRAAASAGLEGFAALRVAREQEIEQIRELANKQREAARQQFGVDAGGAFGLIGSAEQRAIAAANAKFDAEQRALARERAKEIEKLRREGFQAIQEATAATSHGLTQILNNEVVELNRILNEELELREKYKDNSISLDEQRKAVMLKTEREIAEFRRQNAEETRRIEEQAALASLPPWQQTYAGIIVQAQQREREVAEALRKTEISEEDAARRVTAIWQEAHAQQRAALVGTLEEFAAGPMEFFKRRWKQMLMQMLADTILASSTLRNIFGSIFGVPLGGQQGGGGAGSGIFGSIFGGGSPGGTPPFNPSGFLGGIFGGGSPGIPLGFQDVGGGIPGLSGVGLSGGRSGTLSSSGGAGQPGAFGNLGRGGQMFVGIAGLLGGLLSGSGNRFVRATGRGLSGAAIGAAIGSVIPGIGTVIGALIGGAIGFLSGIFGGGMGKKRDKFLKNEFQPAVDQVVKAYEFHQLDYMGAISQLQSLEEQGVQQLKQLKGDGHRARDIVRAAIQKIDGIEAERQRRLALNFNPPQFHQGGAVTAAHAAPSNLLAFPSRPLRAVPSFHEGGDVLARLQLGEGVLSRRGMRAVGGPAGLDAMNRGGGAAGGMTVIVQGPLVAAHKVDQEWLDSGGAEQILRSIRRAAMRGAA